MMYIVCLQEKTLCSAASCIFLYSQDEKDSSSFFGSTLRTALHVGAVIS